MGDDNHIFIVTEHDDDYCCIGTVFKNESQARTFAEDKHKLSRFSSYDVVGWCVDPDGSDGSDGGNQL